MHGANQIGCVRLHGSVPDEVREVLHQELRESAGASRVAEVGASTIAPMFADPTDSTSEPHSEVGSEPSFELIFDADRLQLVPLATGARKPVHVDFVSERMHWRTGAGAASEPLLRACGVHRQRGLRVMDATGGLGRDAWMLARSGSQVDLVERHPVLVALLRDGLRRATASPHAEIASRLRIRNGDSASAFDAERHDVAYLDPMYPPRRKSALGSGELRHIATLLAADGVRSSSAEMLVQAARQAGISRVVLKRPAKEVLAGVASPDHCIGGRSTRFDVWLKPGGSADPDRVPD